MFSRKSVHRLPIGGQLDRIDVDESLDNDRAQREEQRRQSGQNDAQIRTCTRAHQSRFVADVRRAVDQLAQFQVLRHRFLTDNTIRGAWVLG